MYVMNKRIRELRKELGLTKERFGEHLGVGTSAISKIESGERGVTDQMFVSICREFDVNEEWLRTGEGSMFREKSQREKAAYVVGKVLKGDDEFRQKVFIAPQHFHQQNHFSTHSRKSALLLIQSPDFVPDSKESEIPLS